MPNNAPQSSVPFPRLSEILKGRMTGAHQKEAAEILEALSKEIYTLVVRLAQTTDIAVRVFKRAKAIESGIANLLYFSEIPRGEENLRILGVLEGYYDILRQATQDNRTELFLDAMRAEKNGPLLRALCGEPGTAWRLILDTNGFLVASFSEKFSQESPMAILEALEEARVIDMTTDEKKGTLVSLTGEAKACYLDIFPEVVPD